MFHSNVGVCLSSRSGSVINDQDLQRDIGAHSDFELLPIERGRLRDGLAIEFLV